MITPVIIGVTGMATKCLKKVLKATPGKHSIDSLQNAAVLGTSHSAAVRNVKAERGGSPLVQEKYRGEKVCDKRRRLRQQHNNNNNNNNSRDNKQGTCMLKDVPIPGDRNVNKKEAEMILKYKDLKRDTAHVECGKSKVMPVIIRATETISESFRQYPSDTPGNHEIKELQKQTYWALHTYSGKY